MATTRDIKAPAMEVATPENIEKLRSMLGTFKCAMFTTMDQEYKTLHSRPMALIQPEKFNGQSLWFFTCKHSSKADELKSNNCMNVALQSATVFMSLVGKGFLLDDRTKGQELWNESFRPWFPEGLNDPELCLIRFDVEGAEYWNLSGGLTSLRVKIGSFLKSAFTGETTKEKTEESKKIQISGTPMKQTIS